MATIGKVDAIGNNPNCAFVNIRTNLNGNKRITRIDSRSRIYVPEQLGNYDYDEFEYGFYRETITEGLTVYLNPYAKYPLERSVILNMYSSGINILRYDFKEDDLDESLCHDDFLVHRFVHKVR